MSLYEVFSRRGPRQLPHSPHPISTTAHLLCRVFLVYITIVILHYSCTKKICCYFFISVLCSKRNLMTLTICFRDRLRFSLYIITAYCLIFKENQITIKQNPISTLSGAHADMKMFQHYEPCCSCLSIENFVFQLEEILIDQLPKCLRQSKITDFFIAKCV